MRGQVLKEKAAAGKATRGRVAVAFSSGFFGFFAHAGFLSAIRALGVAPSAYGGSSSGAIVAAMAAAGMEEGDIEETLRRLRKSSFWDPDPWRVLLAGGLRLFRGYTGYLKGERFARLLRVLPARRFEELPFPLAVAATNLTEKSASIFTEGDLVKAVQASGAVPGLFKPVEIDGAWYADGGIACKAPVRAVAALARPDRVIVHFIGSQNLNDDPNSFLKKRLTPWHIHYAAGNIARQEAYKMELEMVRMGGVEVIEVETHAPALGPNNLQEGFRAYRIAKEEALRALSPRVSGW